jgi:hypothetical protein
MTAPSMGAVEAVALTALQPHPQDVTIYGEAPDAALETDIRQRGILQPLLVTHAGVIVSGHRRWRAARAIGLPSVPVVRFGSDDPLDILEALVTTNRTQRVRTTQEIGREAQVLAGVEQARAKARMLAGKRSRPDPEDSGPQGVRAPQSRDAIGAKLGVSGKTVERALDAVNAMDALAAQGRQAEADTIAAALQTSARNGQRVARQILAPPVAVPPLDAAATRHTDWEPAGEFILLRRAIMRTLERWPEGESIQPLADMLMHEAKNLGRILIGLRAERTAR